MLPGQEGKQWAFRSRMTPPPATILKQQRGREDGGVHPGTLLVRSAACPPSRPRTPGSLVCGKCDLCPDIPVTHTQATWVTGLMKSKRHARSWLEIGRPRQALSLHLNGNDVVSGYHGQAQHTGFPSREGIWKGGSGHQGGKPAPAPPLLSHDFQPPKMRGAGRLQRGHARVRLHRIPGGAFPGH